MYDLYYFPLSPHSREIRLLLGELRIQFELRTEQILEQREGFLRINPAGTVPVLIDQGYPICGARAIAEFLIEQSDLEDASDRPHLLGRIAHQRAETRRLCDWFELKFNDEVIRLLVGEKIMKHLGRGGAPDSDKIRAGHRNLSIHMQYIEWLMARRSWLAGEAMTLADLAAAAHLSCVDYAGCINWDRFPEAQNWYARLKSRPSFRPLLQERIAGTSPPGHYSDLDF
ncbi:MAG: glutathione S-transferase family protein [Pseudomonadota bacterium]